MLVCFDLIEFVHNISLPAEVFEDPNFLHVYFAAADMIAWANVSRSLLIVEWKIDEISARIYTHGLLNTHAASRVTTPSQS